MLKRLPGDVTQFLLDVPGELDVVRRRMADIEELRSRPAREAAERERISKLPLAPCKGFGYGCGTLTPGGYPCDSCKEDFKNDPDAYK